MAAVFGNLEKLEYVKVTEGRGREVKMPGKAEVCPTFSHHAALQPRTITGPMNRDPWYPALEYTPNDEKEEPDRNVLVEVM